MGSEWGHIISDIRGWSNHTRRAYDFELEGIASGTGLVRQAKLQRLNYEDAHAIADDARAGKREAVDLFLACSEALAGMFYTLSLGFNPEVFAVSGGMINIQDLWLPRAIEIYREGIRSKYPVFEKPIKVSRLGTESRRDRRRETSASMMHLPGIINDLALILMTAGVVTLVFRRLKQPVVLGYLLAGFLVGPHFIHTPTVSDAPNVQVWSEIGIIFLLFALGLEFSFKKLAKVGGSASITASIEVIFMVAIGYVTGQALGWSAMDSLFLGGVLAISSTTIIIRAFEEVGVKGRGFVSLVFGVLIVEDMIAILLLVLLSTVAVTQSLRVARCFIRAEN